MKIPVTMHCNSRLAMLAFAFTLAGAAAATDYSENEPNNGTPASFLPGNPTFLSGDRLVGAISSTTDVDDHFITVQGGGGPGIYRYSFDLNSNGADSFLEVYDQANHRTMGANDDRTSGDLSSMVVFDHFATNANNPVFGVGIERYSGPSTFNYAMTVTRSLTPVAALGSLASGITTTSGTLQNLAGSWHQFSLGTLSNLVIDTFNSAEPDTMLVVLNSSGQLVGANDDENYNGGITSAKLTLNNLSAGTYYAIVGTFPSYFEYNLATNQPVAWDRRGFSGGSLSGNGNYNLRFNAAPVPEPGTLAALGLGVAALVRRRRKA